MGNKQQILTFQHNFMYKKLILIVLSVITIHAAKAQTEKGSQSLGATFGVSVTNANTQNISPIDNSSTSTKGKLTTYSLSPSYSYFIADKLDLGAGIGYSFSKQTYDPPNTQVLQRTLNYSANIFLRKYFLFDDKIGVRTGPYLNYQKSKQRYTYSTDIGDSNFNTDTYGGGLGMDFVYFPAKNVGLAATIANLSYQHTKYTDSTIGDSNQFSFSFVNYLAFSVYYIFGK
jgi:hypothetical protein